MTTAVDARSAAWVRGRWALTMTSGTEAKPRVPVSTWRATRERRMADMVHVIGGGRCDPRYD